MPLHQDKIILFLSSVIRKTTLKKELMRLKYNLIIYLLSILELFFIYMCIMTLSNIILSLDMYISF